MNVSLGRHPRVLPVHHLMQRPSDDLLMERLDRRLEGFRPLIQLQRHQAVDGSLYLGLGARHGADPREQEFIPPGQHEPL